MTVPFGISWKLNEKGNIETQNFTNRSFINTKLQAQPREVPNKSVRPSSSDPWGKGKGIESSHIVSLTWPLVSPKTHLFLFLHMCLMSDAREGSGKFQVARWLDNLSSSSKKWPYRVELAHYDAIFCEDMGYTDLGLDDAISWEWKAMDFPWCDLILSSYQPNLMWVEGGGSSLTWCFFCFMFVSYFHLFLTKLGGGILSRL